MELIICITAFIAGMVQSLSGFGAGIMMMMIFPYFLQLKTSAALSGIIGLTIALSIAYKRRKAIKLKKVILPAILYLISSGVSIYISSQINLDILKPIFGLLLVVLAIYFTLFSNKIHLENNILTITVCSITSGIMGGLFGIGGPFLVLYFLSISSTNEEYAGNLNFVLGMCEIYNIIMRIKTGIITINLLPYIIIGSISILIASILGGKIADKMDGEIIKKIIYAMLLLSGVITIIQSI